MRRQKALPVEPQQAESNWLTAHRSRMLATYKRTADDPIVQSDAMRKLGEARRRLEDLRVERELGLR